MLPQERKDEWDPVIPRKDDLILVNNVSAVGSLARAPCSSVLVGCFLVP